jgi:cation diffusion facilitator family transporter
MTALSSQHTQDADSKREAARWSLVSNTGLLAIKAVAGVLTGSVGIVAEIINSAADLIASSVAWLSVRASDEPPDRLHAYGHGKIENLSGIFTAMLVLGGAVYAIYQAVMQILHPSKVDHIRWGMAVMVVSAITNIVVSSHLLRVGKETDSPAVTADGHHLRTDVLTSLGVLLGLILVQITHLRWWDSVAALFVSFLILRVGVGLAQDAIGTLSDSALPDAEEAVLEETLRNHPAVLGFHKLRTRKSGSHRHVDVHVLLADTHTFVEAHRLTEELEDNLRAALPNLHPIIHVEPFEEETAHQRREHGETLPPEPMHKPRK